jgi:hypothetical protein
MPRDTEQLFIPAPVVIETDRLLKALQDARQWLSDPAHWTKRRAWRDRTGMETISADCIGSTCALGAISYGMFRNTRDVDVPLYIQAVDALEASLQSHGGIVPGFNDDPRTTHADILALFDRAISARRAELAKEG